MKGDKGLATRFKSSTDKGRRDDRKLTIRLHTSERDAIAVMTKELDLSSDTQMGRVLLEYAIKQVQEKGVGILSSFGEK